MFQLTEAEWRAANLPQFAGGSQRHRNPSKLPLAFTEHGCVLLDEIRRLTQFPEEPKRGIGFTAPWPEET
jgi:hypothetical protein